LSYFCAVVKEDDYTQGVCWKLWTCYLGWCSFNK